MRPETEILELVLNFARSRDDIRVVVMNGSRVNPDAKKDPFQDYDIACYVLDVAPYRGDQRIPPMFGEILILQTPEGMGDPPPEQDGFYSFLMQFRDGSRIDLSFHPLEKVAKIPDDSLSLVLLDKDGRVPALPPPSNRSYLPQKPTAKEFADCCNEFWWLNPYAAKGLWRGELTYARYMLDTLMRGELLKMLKWYFGVNTNFEKSPGKLGKYLKSGLEPEVWALLEKTYSDAREEHTWDALYTMGSLFRQAALVVAGAFGFPYPEGDGARVSVFIRQIQALPRDAEVDAVTFDAAASGTGR